MKPLTQLPEHVAAGIHTVFSDIDGKRKLKRRHMFDEATRAANTARMAQVPETILREVPGCAVASDQFCRLYDLAIDVREDVPALPASAVRRIVEPMEAAGMTAKVSSDPRQRLVRLL